MAIANEVIPVPQLGTLGWVTDSANKFDLLLSHFFLSDYNQTYLYKGQVSSLPRIMELVGNDANAVIEQLKQALTLYLKRYYESVEVDVSIKEEESNLSINAELNLKIGISDNGMQKVFGRILQSTDGKIQTIAKANNYE